MSRFKTSRNKMSPTAEHRVLKTLPLAICRHFGGILAAFWRPFWRRRTFWWQFWTYLPDLFTSGLFLGLKLGGRTGPPAPANPTGNPNFNPKNRSW
jgi:hypothetical protein